MIVQRNFVIGRRKHDRARDQIFLGRSWEFLPGRRAFRDCDISCRLNEFFELRVRNRGRIYPEPVDENTVNWLRVIRRHRHFGTAMSVGHSAHGKFATRNPDHTFRPRLGRPAFR